MLQKNISLSKFFLLVVSRRRYLPNVDSSGNESVSEGSEYVLTDDDGSDDSDETHSSNNNEGSDVSEEENNAKKRIKQSGIVKKSPPKRGITNTPRKIVIKGRKTTSYKDYVSFNKIVVNMCVLLTLNNISCDSICNVSST